MDWIVFDYAGVIGHAPLDNAGASLTDAAALRADLARLLPADAEAVTR